MGTEYFKAKVLLCCIIVLGMLFLTWWSLWRWNDVTSSMLVMGNLVTFREVLQLLAKDITHDESDTNAARANKTNKTNKQLTDLDSL